MSIEPIGHLKLLRRRAVRGLDGISVGTLRPQAGSINPWLMWVAEGSAYMPQTEHGLVKSGGKSALFHAGMDRTMKDSNLDWNRNQANAENCD
ncbi:hypothetical protein GCM10025794_21870 [Massilia kyonggiensis]